SQPDTGLALSLIAKPGSTTHRTDTFILCIDQFWVLSTPRPNCEPPPLALSVRLCQYSDTDKSAFSQSETLRVGLACPSG
ncbi:MAG: hypothetical protein AAFO87_14120, partial [Cyanobacteria bacterium J06607_6]